MQHNSPHVDRDWNNRYETGNTPWDSGLPSAELRRQFILLRDHLPSRRALELGCGTGTNAIWLAQQGLDVTAVDCASEALRMARDKAEKQGTSIHWIEADVQHFGSELPSFAFLFDRGCYHCCRRVDLTGYLATMRNLTDPGSYFLCLCGNSNSPQEGGPPKVSEREIRDEFGELFEILSLTEFHFEDAGGTQGPLGWSILMKRK